jgi:hypothetical protein
MAITIEKVIPNPDKTHAPFVRVLLGDGTAVEFTVKKEVYDSLNAAGKKAYVQECMEYHSPTEKGQREARRAAWDADDLARANAAAEEARQAELAKLTVTPQGFVRDEKGEVVGVSVTVTHQGHTTSATIANDPASAEANALAAWQVSKDAADAEAASLAAFALVK